MSNAPEPTNVRIVDIHMPFWSMIVFMIKWAIAALPALLILLFFGAAVAGLLGGVMSSHAPTL